MVNTMQRSEYIREHFIWGLIALIWLRSLLKCIPGYTFVESLLLFGIIGVCTIGFCILITWRRNRNYISLFENILISWGIVVCIAYGELFKERHTYIVGIAMVMAVILSVLIVGRRIVKRDTRYKIMRIRFRHLIDVWKRMAAMASLCIIMPIVTSIFFHGTVMNSNVKAVKVYGEEHSLQENMSEIANIEPSRWEKLTVEEKVDLVQTIVNSAAYDYGISHEISVGTAVLQRGMLAYYEPSTHQIVMDVAHLEESNGFYVLYTILHECTHAIQFEEVAIYQKLNEKERNLCLFENVSVYAEEFSNYVDTEDDFQTYYNQLTERHAREGGIREALRYINELNTYLDLGLNMSEIENVFAELMCNDEE